MAGGLPIQQPSSEAWPEYAAMYSRALNSGWILDQRFDGTGGFITNVTPSSAPGTMQSTGDATAFYTAGRAIRVVQPTGTAIGVVGLSSFGAVSTFVYFSQFSTAAGLSTGISTGAMISVAASPLLAGSTNGNFPGGTFVNPSTLGGSAVALLGNSASLGLGIDPTTGARLTMPPGTFIYFGTLPIYYNDGSASIIRGTGINNDLVVGSGYAGIGPSYASSGVLRLPNSALAIVGKTSTGGDDIIWPHQYSSTTLTSDVNVSGSAIYTNVISKSLGVGTWAIHANVGFWSSMTATVGCRIDDGTNVFATAGVTFNGSTGTTISLPLSAIVSHTTALTYNLAIVSATTTVKAAAILMQSTATSTGATSWTAVKIG